MTKWIEKHAILTVALLITLGISIWYAITLSPLALKVVGIVWFLVVLNWLFRITNPAGAKKIDEALNQACEKENKKTEEWLEKRRSRHAKR